MSTRNKALPGKNHEDNSKIPLKNIHFFIIFLIAASFISILFSNILVQTKVLRLEVRAT